MARVFVSYRRADGVYVGAITPIGAALAWRLGTRSNVRWRPLVATTVLVGVTLGLLTVSSHSGHLALVDVPALPHALLRYWVNLSVTVIGGLAFVFCVLAPLFSSPKAARHRLGDRIRYLAIARDAERWGAALLSAEFALLAAAGAAVLLAVDQSGADDIDASPLPNLAFALVFSTILITFHLWSITRLRDAKRALAADLAALPPRYRDNAEPRLVARSFDDGGWGFRALLALPAIVTALAATAMLVW